MRSLESKTKRELLHVHANGKYPCPFGCHFNEYSNGKLQLTGDCRAPANSRCHLNGEDTIRKLQERANDTSDGT